MKYSLNRKPINCFETIIFTKDCLRAASGIDAGSCLGCDGLEQERAYVDCRHGVPAIAGPVASELY